MSRRRSSPSSLIFAALIALIAALPLFALDVPPKPTAWVTDNGDIVSPEQEQALNERLEALAKDPNGAQFLIMTFPSLEGDDIDDYANRVADQWKVKGDRALILLVAVRDHKMAIRTGYSLEADVTDAFSSRIIRETIAPRFRQQDYFGGLDAAVTQLAQKIDPTFSVQSRSLPPSSRRTSGATQVAPRDVIFFIFIILIFLFVIGPMLRRSGCGGCGGCWPFFLFPGGGGGTTLGGGGGGGGGGGWSVGGSWGGGGGSSFGGGGASGGW